MMHHSKPGKCSHGGTRAMERAYPRIRFGAGIHLMKLPFSSNTSVWNSARVEITK
jgi:hypothetical protein